MTDKNSIRLLWRQGDSVAEIARKTGVSRDTVYKYRDMDDFSPEPPARRAQGSKLDPYRPLIESWLDDDMRSGRKQRHTAKRVHDRLVSECGADVSVSTVERCVREIRARRSAEAADAQYLDLVWGPGEAQADFGEADFYVRGMRTTLSFFVMTFPYSNVGLAQVFPGETSECVCQALRNVFEHVGGVPTKIVFDNATGVGRRVGGGVRTTELFAACSAHYGFRFRFCNPRSGNEKGSVENKVGCVRRNLFVPVPQLWDAGAFNRRLLERSLAMSDKPHWIKGERELDLFEADRLAMLGLPAKPLDCVTYVSRTADKKGKVSVGERGRHLYSTHPSLDNPGRLRSEASFAAICGACPIPASSGKTVRHRLNRGGDRQANSALHEIARQRVMRDPETAEYAERARARGKSDREVMRYLKRYVAREAYRALMHPHEIRRPEDASELVAARRAAKVSQVRAASILGTSEKYISMLERGQRELKPIRRAYEAWVEAGLPLDWDRQAFEAERKMDSKKHLAK